MYRNILYILTVICIVSPAYAYQIVINNETHVPIEFQVAYTGAIAKDTVGKIQPGKNETLSIGGRCTKFIVARATYDRCEAGKNTADQQVKFETEGRCTNISVTVSENYTEATVCGKQVKTDYQLQIDGKFSY